MAQSHLQILPKPALVARIATCCIERGRSVGVAESCTGGMVAAALTDVPGASHWFKGGVVSYSEAVKVSLLDVSRALLERAGAVSADVAEAMACGARRVLGVDVAVSITGLAGSDGDGVHNVGTVFIGVALSTGVEVAEHHFSGNRAEVRAQASVAALEALLAALGD